MSSPSQRQRVAVLGLDAAEWTIVEQLMAAGDLPNLSRVRQHGTTCRLRQATPLTEQPWAAFLTGLPAPETALRFEPDTYGIYEVGAPRVAPFYAQPGLRALVLDVPRMNLGFDVEGAQVIGWGGHHLGYPRASRPAGMLSQLDAEIGPHDAFSRFNEFRWYDGRDLGRLTSRMIAGAHRRVDAVRWLVNRFPEWDLILTVSPEAHTLGQILWHGFEEDHPIAARVSTTTARRQLIDVYRALDSTVGRFVEVLPPDVTFVICSVHGIKRNHSDVTSALLPELLSRVFVGERRFAVPDPAEWRRRGYPPVQPGISTFAARYGPPTTLAQRVSGWFGHHARHHAPAVVAASRRLGGKEHELEPETGLHPDAVGESRLPGERHVACRYRDLWPRMKAFALPTYTIGRIRINVRGREGEGIVPPEMYEAVCDEVETLIRACRNPRTGRPVVDDVIRTSSGSRTPEVSYDDLTVVWGDCSDALEHPTAGVVGPLAYGRTGAHSTQGFALIAGPGIPHADLGERPALDLTPTILSLVGRVPGGHLHGQPFLHRQ